MLDIVSPNAKQFAALDERSASGGHSNEQMLYIEVLRGFDAYSRAVAALAEIQPGIRYALTAPSMQVLQVLQRAGETIMGRTGVQS